MLGDRIREERKRKGFSQERLGMFLGLTQQSIAKWEKNIAEPDSISIIKLSEIFQVSTDYLLGKTDDKNSNIANCSLLGDKVRELRKNKNLSQTDIANIFNVKQNTVSQWESGINQIDNDTLNALADFFQVSTDYLLGRSDDSNPANCIIFGERLKELRKLRNITQTQLANELNVAIGTVGNWETGQREPALDMVIRVADYFNVSVDYLVGQTDNKESVLITQIAHGSGMTTTEIPLENAIKFAELTETCVIFKEYGKEKKKIKISPDQIDLAISLIETLQKNKI